MNLLAYAVKVVACSGILFGYYALFLRNKRFHQYNRFYILGSTLFSVIFPLFRIPVFAEVSRTSYSWIKPLSAVSVNGWEEAFVLTARAGSHAWWLYAPQTGWGLYAAGLMICAVPVVRSLLYIKNLFAVYQKEMLDDIAFYNTQESGTPFSFFRTIFWNDRIPLDEAQGWSVLQHEIFHIRAKHSYDVIFFQFINSLFWFNPFFHIAFKELKTIHEFLADEWAGSTVNRFDYAELLVTEALERKRILFSHQFFHHQIKRRITMIIKQPTSNRSYWSRIMTLPLLAAVFGAFALEIGCRDNTLVPAQAQTADAAKGSVKSNAVILPAADFMKIMASRSREVASFNWDSSNNLLITTFMKGDSILTRYDEFANLNQKNGPVMPPLRKLGLAKPRADANFPGGQMAYMRFLNRTFRYPLEAQQQEIQGPVIVEFNVSEEGDVSDVHAISGPEKGGLKEEAVRVISVSGKWEPALLNGRPVASIKKQPIIFRLDTE